MTSPQAWGEKIGKSMIKILLFGDIFGRLGREALAKVLSELKQSVKPDLVVANVENLAHGKGVSLATLSEMKSMGVDVFTSGNHVFDKMDQLEECFKEFPTLIRPNNYPATPGRGWCRLVKNGQSFLVANLAGQVFFEKQYKGVTDNPFHSISKLIDQEAVDGDIILVDLHAEATSEKIAMGYHLDGKASVVVGTHTHVPTADHRILPQGTAYVTDLGMTGALNSVIGVVKENVLRVFLGEDEKFRLEPEITGPAIVNAILVTIADNGDKSIERIQRVVEM